jgi:hypothetical protein
MGKQGSGKSQKTGRFGGEARSSLRRMQRRLAVESLEWRELLAADIGYQSMAITHAPAPVETRAAYEAPAVPSGSGAVQSPTMQQAGARDQDRIRDPKQDGSCQTATTTATSTLLATADQTRQRDQDRIRDPKQDGSCQTAAATTTLLATADQTRQRDQDRIRDPKQDGSCQTAATTLTAGPLAT